MVSKAPVMTAWGWQGLYVGGQGRLDGRPRRHQPQLRRSVRRRTGAAVRRPTAPTASAARIFGVQAGYNWVHRTAGGRHRGRHPGAAPPRRSATSLHRATSATRGSRRSMRRLRCRSITGSRGSARCAAASAPPITPDLLPTSRPAWRSARSRPAVRMSGFDGDRQPEQRLVQPQRRQGRLDGRRRIGERISPATGPPRPNISTWTSASSRSSPASDTGCHRRDHDQSAPHRQHRAGRHQLQTELTAQTEREVLIAMPGLWAGHPRLVAAWIETGGKSWMAGTCPARRRIPSRAVI